VVICSYEDRPVCFDFTNTASKRLGTGEGVKTSIKAQERLGWVVDVNLEAGRKRKASDLCNTLQIRDWLHAGKRQRLSYQVCWKERA